MDCRKWIDLASTDFKLKYNSEATVENYLSQVSVFLSRFKGYREPKEIPNQDIKKWLLEAQTINTRKSRLCAIRAFYKHTVCMPNKIQSIEYPKSDKKLPIVLSQQEMQSMFDACENLKHKVILSLLYMCGLRVSELINLKWSDIDRSRMVINIIQAKGKKDRQVGLSPAILPLLEKYYRLYKPVEYVINGQSSPMYSERSVGQVIKSLAERAGIKKRVYTHLIRHCAFTHMVEEGTDINIIQKIAGHSNVKTTMIYTHISHNIISKVKSPLESIQL